MASLHVHFTHIVVGDQDEHFPTVVALRQEELRVAHLFDATQELRNLLAGFLEELENDIKKHRRAPECEAQTTNFSTEHQFSHKATGKYRILILMLSWQEKFGTVYSVLSVAT